MFAPLSPVKLGVLPLVCCSVGDLVFGQAAGCLGTAVLSTHHTVVPVPPNVSPDAACTVPTVFLTADACLNAATVVQPGQTVLIHAATGEAASDCQASAPFKVLVCMCLSSF